MQDVNHLMSMYSRALADMWKNYYAPQNDPAMVAQFTAFDYHLFRAVVVWPLDPLYQGETTVGDFPFGRGYRRIDVTTDGFGVEPIPFLRVLPCTDLYRRGFPLRITWLTPGADDSPPTRTTDRLLPVSIDLRLIEVVKQEVDFCTYRCRVMSYSGDQKKQGLDALIHEMDSRVIYDPLMVDRRAAVKEAAR